MSAARAGARALAAAIALALAVGACSDDAGDTAPPAATGTTASGATASGAAGAARVLRADVVGTRTHDTALFTEGLELTPGVRYESSGGYGSSEVRAVDRGSGAVLARFTLPPAFFGEGLTRVGDEVILLTWRERTAFVLDATTLAEKRRISYEGEGWGICALGDAVVTSDGSSLLRIRDPRTFAVRRTVDVRLDGASVRELNELECTADGVFANVWQTDRIVRIDPATGAVTGVLDVPELRPAATRADDDAVLNGIARDPATGRFVLTGKRWPLEYDVTIAASQ